MTEVINTSGSSIALLTLLEHPPKDWISRKDKDPTAFNEYLKEQFPKMHHVIEEHIEHQAMDYIYSQKFLPDNRVITIDGESFTFNPRLLAKDSKMIYQSLFDESEGFANVKLDWQDVLEALFTGMRPNTQHILLNHFSGIDIDFDSLPEGERVDLCMEIQKLDLRSLLVLNTDELGRPIYPYKIGKKHLEPV